MKFANVDCLLFRTSEQTELASPEQLAAWLRLIVLASERETGGVLRGAGAWKDGTAKHYLRFGGRELMTELVELGLLIPSDDSSDLRVFGYDVYAEETYLAKCRGGRKGAKKRWKPHVGIGEENTASNDDLEPVLDTEVSDT